MSRTPTSLLVLALIALLASCAQPGPAPQDGADTLAAAPAQPASAPEVAPVLPVAEQAPKAAQSDEEASQEPVIIRGSDRMVAPPGVPARAQASGAASRLQFDNAPVGDVVNVMLRDLLKVDYVIHPPLNGAITLTTRQAVSADRAMLLLETALQANGIVMARDSSGTYHVGTPEALRSIISAPVLATPGEHLPPGYGAVIIAPQYVGASEMANILRPLVAPDAIQRVDTVRNVLVMRGTRAEAEGWMDLVNTFDVNLLRGMSVAIFPLKHSSAADVDAALRLLSGGTLSGAAGSGAPQAGGAPGRPQPPARPLSPAQQAAQQRAAAMAAQAGGAGASAGLGESSPLFGAVRVLPIERINAVMVVTPRAAYLDEMRYWIEQFDRPNMNSSEPQLFVYKVQNGSADHLAELINGIYGGTINNPQSGGANGVAPGLNSANRTSGAFGNNTGLGGNTGFGNSFGNTFGSSGGALGGNSLNNRIGQNTLAGRNAQQASGSVSTVVLGDSVRVMADGINNTLLIYAMPSEYERIEATLKRLDVPRAQVLIEASIIEVTLTDDLKYGLQWAFNNRVRGGRSGTGALGDAAGILGAASQGFTYTLKGAAGLTNILTALANKSLIRVISSPSLMVLDNHTAAIQVGQQVPVNIGGTSTSGLVGDIVSTTNIQYKDIGVMLDVTPSISAGDLITLDINQMVTDLDTSSNSSATQGSPTFMQRQISSMVAVRSGETIALGGLIKDNTQNGKSGLPLLSTIPVIGALFGTQDNSSTRTELLVVITPRVIRSDEDARAVSRELRERMRGLTLSSDADAAAGNH